MASLDDLLHNAVELTELRERDVKHYHLGGNQYAAVIGRNLHYKAQSNGPWIDPSEMVVQQSAPGTWTVTTADLSIQANYSAMTLTYLPQNISWQWVFQGTGSGNNIVYDGIPWQYVPSPWGVKSHAVVNAPRGPRTYDWMYLSNAQGIHVDEKGNIKAGPFVIYRPFVIGANGERYECGPWDLSVPFHARFVFDDSELPPDAFPYVIDPSTNLAIADDDDDINLVGEGDSHPPPYDWSVFDDTELYVVRQHWDDWFTIYNALLRWDTSPLAGKIITGAELAIHITNLIDIDGYALRGEYYTPTTWPADGPDYTGAGGNNAIAGIPLSELEDETVNVIPLDNVENINTSGYTVLRLTLTGEDSTPTNVNQVRFASFEHASLPAPVLIVTYEDAPSVGTITGTVTDARSEQPISGATVTSDDEEETVTDVTGTYTLDVTPGERTITVTHPDYHSDHDTVTVEPAGEETVDFALEPKVYVTTTDLDGRFVFPDVLPGPYTIQFIRENYHPYEDEVEAEVGAVKTLDIGLLTSLLSAAIARSAEWIVRARASVQRTSQYGIRSRVASSRLSQWHQRTLLARSADVGWDIRSLLSLERVAGWHTRVAAALNRGIAYGIRAAVGRYVAATFDLRALATAARESRWNVRQWLATTRLAAWHARTTAGSQRTISFSQRAITRGVRDVKWSVRALVTRSADASWHIRATVASAGRAVAWGVRASVDTARATQWAVRSRIAAARDMTWNILGSAVMATRKIRYHVRTAFTDTRAAQWGIRITVGDTRATQWSLRALAAATRQTAWHIRARLSAMRAPIWHVRRTVSDTRQPTWYVRTVADTARQVRYVVRALVPVTRQPNWRVRSLLTAMRDGIWHVRERLSTTRDGIWHVRSRVAATRESLWRVRGLLAATRESLWRVRGLLATTRESRWSVGALVAYATRTAVWGVRRTATQARGAAWHVRTMAVTARDAAWHALRTLAADRDTRWDIRVTVGTDRPISWLVRARLAIGRTASFGIRRTAIRTARLVWAILSRFVSAPIRASDVGEVVEAAERDGIGAAEVAALIDIEVIDMGVISRWYAGATRPIQVVVSRVDGKAMTITQATVRVRPQGSDEWSAPLPALVEGQTITANVTLLDPGIYEIRFDYQTDDGIIDIVLVRRRAHALDA